MNLEKQNVYLASIAGPVMSNVSNSSKPLPIAKPYIDHLLRLPFNLD